MLLPARAQIWPKLQPSTLSNLSKLPTALTQYWHSKHTYPPASTQTSSSLKTSRCNIMKIFLVNTLVASTMLGQCSLLLQFWCISSTISKSYQFESGPVQFVSILWTTQMPLLTFNSAMHWGVTIPTSALTTLLLSSGMTVQLTLINLVVFTLTPPSSTVLILLSQTLDLGRTGPLHSSLICHFCILFLISHFDLTILHLRMWCWYSYQACLSSCHPCICSWPLR